MMEFITEYGLFLAKVATVVIALLAAAGSLLAMAMRHKKGSESELHITLMNKEFEEMESALASALLDSHALKSKLKRDHKKEKKKAKQQLKHEKKLAKEGSKQESRKKRLFVIDFDGDIRASATDAMRHEISAILTDATDQDEVLLRLESGGGMVHSYGLAASQLQRITDHEIALTIAVDKVAASGGYMMACVANKIIAAPFSIVGSIGVLAQIPNLHRLLKKNEVDFEQLSAGEYKRTLTLFGENTEKGRQKMQQELEETHTLFKNFIGERRPGLDVESVATGEHWLGTRALELGLVDQLQTSDDFLMEAREHSDLIHLEYTRKKSLAEKISSMLTGIRSQKEKSVQDMDKHLLM